MFLTRECFRGISRCQTMSRYLINTFKRSMSNGKFQQKLKNYNEEISETERFSVIYRFPEIFVGSLINKVKKMQLYVSCATLPVTYGLFFIDQCDFNTVILITTCCAVTTLTTMAMGHFCTRTIGFVYISKDGEEVKISYVDFWGKRKDKCIPTDEILSMSHSPKYLTDMLYRKVFLTSSVKPLKLMKFGTVTNTESFYKVFNFELEHDEKETNDN